LKGLPSDIDLSPLVGRQLSQVSIGRWNAALHFGEAIRLTVESAILLTGKSGYSQTIEDFRADASAVCVLIGEDVLDAKRTLSGGCALRLSSGVRLEAVAVDNGFESFQICLGDRVFVA
jgi:hypothetical protein